jgi:DNA-binding transcriptional MerR regulator
MSDNSADAEHRERRFGEILVDCLAGDVGEGFTVLVVMTERSWRIGELAASTGLTLRSLRHYDSIGLVVPERTDAGQRCYREGQVRRLYGVLALRRLGFSLAQIREALDDEGCSPLSMVRAQLKRLEHERGARERLRVELERIAATLERSSEPSVGDLIAAIEAIGALDAAELVTEGLDELNHGGLERLASLMDPEIVWFDQDRGPWDCRDRGDVMRRLRELVGQGAQFELLEVEQQGNRVLVGVRNQQEEEVWILVTLRDGRVVRMDGQPSREDGRRSLAAAPGSGQT